MRKCPNCKKAIPVGARRCVHCRTLVGEHDDAPASTAIGVSSRDPYDIDRRGNSTSFGRPNSNNRLEPVIGSSRNSQRMMDDMPHHTMLGLGPISSDPITTPKRNSSSRVDEDMNNHTMMGNPVTGRQSSGSSARSSFSVQDEPHMTSIGISPVKKSPEPAPARGGLDFSDLSLDQLDFGNKPVTKTAAPSNDPLSGLAGVAAAPVPSSLIDEKFDDLTAKLFGADFAGGKEEEPAEEDGFDFDFDPAPAPAPLNFTSTLEPAKTEPLKKEVAKTTSQKTVTTSKPAESSKSSNVELDTKKNDKKDNTGIGITGIVAIVAAILSILCFIPALGATAPIGGFLIVATILAIAFDLASIKIGKSLPQIAAAGIFAVLAVLLFIALSGSEAAKEVSSIKIFVIIAAIGQLACALLYFNRKA